MNYNFDFVSFLRIIGGLSPTSPIARATTASNLVQDLGILSKSRFYPLCFFVVHDVVAIVAADVFINLHEVPVW